MMWVDLEALNYLPILILVLVAAGVGVFLVVANIFIGAKDHEKNSMKGSTYECGVTPIGNAQQQFSVRYYVVGIVFLLFDVEVVFLYPWAVIYRKFISQGAFILIEMLSFMAILLVGYIYLLRKKGLDWE